jgi:hypothetical protein
VTFLAVLPSIWPPYSSACLDGMAPEFRRHVLVVDNTTHNRGVAASWNVGARVVLEDRLDWLVVVSAATRFGSEGGRDFLKVLDVSDGWVVESGAPVGWHLLAWSRRILERVGLFDENYHPAYGEDADVSRRVHVAQAEDGEPTAWECHDGDVWIASRGHGTELAGVEPNIARSIRYHERKWGGWSGHERFRRPFDTKRPLSWWPRPPHRWAVRHEGWQWAAS